MNKTLSLRRQWIALAASAAFGIPTALCAPVAYEFGYREGVRQNIEEAYNGAVAALMSSDSLGSAERSEGTSQFVVATERVGLLATVKPLEGSPNCFSIGVQETRTKKFLENIVDCKLTLAAPRGAQPAGWQNGVRHRQPQPIAASL